MIITDEMIILLAKNIRDDRNCMLIFNCISKNGSLNLSQISRETGLSLNMVQRTIPKLEGAMFIEKNTGFNTGRSTIYNLSQIGQRLIKLFIEKKKSKGDMS